MCHRRRWPLLVPNRCNAQILCSASRFVLTCFLSGIREAKFNFKRHLDIYKLPDQSSNDLILSRQRTLTAGGGGGGEGVGPALTLHTAALHQLTVTAFGLSHSKLWQPPSKIFVNSPAGSSLRGLSRPGTNLPYWGAGMISLQVKWQ